MTISKKIYKDYIPDGQKSGVLPIVENRTVLEIGFGSGNLLKELSLKGNKVYGTDVSQSVLNKASSEGHSNLFLVDASEQPMPFEDNFFDAVYCYEVFEHLTNPHKMFFEIRRILKPGHHLYFSVPTQEHTMGYGPSRHSFVYPGLLERKNLERFFMQMYFKIDYYTENNQGIVFHRNYILKNLKNLNRPDIMEVIIRDYSVLDLYEQVLDPGDLHKEIEREIAPYITILKNQVKEGNWEHFDRIASLVTSLYPRYYSLYITIAEILFEGGNIDNARILLEKLIESDIAPEHIKKRINNIIVGMSDNRPN